MRLPLAGVRVIDMTQFLAGPYCTMILGDLGADVIKVEPPGGDPQRTAMRLREGEDAPSFVAVNRNKRGVVLDLRSTSGRERFADLLRSADVLVENFRPGVTTDLGIDYESVRSVRPTIIYASVTAFGASGPWAQRPGYDAIAQAMTGLMSITGLPGSGPVKVGVPVTDLAAGLFAAIGILAAHVQRLQTGEGQLVTTSLFEAGLALAVHEAASFWATSDEPGPLGSGHRFLAPYQGLRTRDGYVTIGVGTERQWERLCAAIGRHELVEDERFRVNRSRMEHLQALVVELEETLREETTDHWVEGLLAAGVPAGPILGYSDVLSAEHTRSRGMVVEYQHPALGPQTALGSAFKLSGAVPPPMMPAPGLGQHQDEVMAELPGRSELT